jgi:hypothetical protein
MDTEPKNMCEVYEVLLEDSVEGHLEGADVQSLAAHVNGCASCRTALEEARESARLLRRAEPTPDPGPAFTHMVMARIRTELPSEERGLWRLVAAFARPFALTATLALGLMLAYSAYRAPGPNSDTAIPTLADTRELISDPAAPPATPDDTLLMVAETPHGQQ